MRWVVIKSKYGISEENYNQMLAEQHGGCAICGRKQRGKKHIYLYVDHNHITGQVRGLLCCSCNSAVGQFRDDPALLRRAIEYLGMVQFG